jgi:arylformamidase
MSRRAEPLYYDVTLPIRDGMPVYPGDPVVEVAPVATVEGDGYAVARLTMSTHTGTHLDPPAHFIPGGITVDEAPLDLLIGPTRVVRVEGVAAIGVEDVEARGLIGVERVLFATRGTTNDQRRTTNDRLTTNELVYLEPAAARVLAEGGTRLVGIDTLSVDPLTVGEVCAHRELLGRGVWILERLELSHVPEGEYELICLPLKIAGGDGAPARVVLRMLGGS